MEYGDWKKEQKEVADSDHPEPELAHVAAVNVRASVCNQKEHGTKFQRKKGEFSFFGKRLCKHDKQSLYAADSNQNQHYVKLMTSQKFHRRNRPILNKPTNDAK